MNSQNNEERMDLSRIEWFMRDHAARTLGKMDPVNIVITGSSGVGKSTLINAVFGKNLAKTGVGKPQTMNIEKIVDPSLPMCLYDTRGLEIADSADTIAQIKNFVEDLRSKLDASDQIHAVWLCILESSNRVEPVHLELLNLFRSYEIPCIVVLTQSQGNEEFVEVVQACTAPVAAVICVMAEAKRTKIGVYEAENLELLVDKTLEILPEARKSAFEYCQKAAWDRKLVAANSAVNWACVAGAAAAPIPIPGGHAAAMIAIETAMLLRINYALGVSIDETEGKTIILGIMGVVASTVGGKMLFAEAMKFIPGIGSVAGALVGGTVAVTITKILGALYIDVVGDLVKSGSNLPKADILIGLLKAAFEARKAQYIRAAKE
jgi:predicted GTPase/uncharacterized protein (DUF697 family)